MKLGALSLHPVCEVLSITRYVDLHAERSAKERAKTVASLRGPIQHGYNVVVSEGDV